MGSQTCLPSQCLKRELCERVDAVLLLLKIVDRESMTAGRGEIMMSVLSGELLMCCDDSSVGRLFSLGQHLNK